jgi:hypothetical protein
VQTTVRRVPPTAVAAIVAVLTMLVAGSCTAESSRKIAQRELVAAGFESARANYVPDLAAGGIVLGIAYRTDVRDAESLGAEYRHAAEVIWTRVPLRFDELRVRATNEPVACVEVCRRNFGRSDLEQLFGARRSSLDKDVEKQLLFAGAVMLGVVALAVTLGIVVVVRWRRRRRLIHGWVGESVSGWAPGGPPPWPPVDPASPWAPPVTPHAPHGPHGPHGPQGRGGPSAAPPAYGQEPRSGPPVPAPAAVAQPWDQPTASPPPEPAYDIWERPPS